MVRLLTECVGRSTNIAVQYHIILLDRLLTEPLPSTLQWADTSRRTRSISDRASWTGRLRSTRKKLHPRLSQAQLRESESRQA